eukprot:1681081-Pleurochrysis_carterae.AAC.1
MWDSGKSASGYGKACTGVVRSALGSLRVVEIKQPTNSRHEPSLRADLAWSVKLRCSIHYRVVSILEAIERNLG